MSSYIAIPYQLFADLSDGKISNRMFNILVWLYRRANFRTGIAQKVSAKRIQAEMWSGGYDDQQPSLRCIQRWFKRLCLCGYIRSHHVGGRRASYSVTICNFPTAKRDENGEIVRDADGYAEEIVLNPMDTLSWQDLPELAVAENDGDLYSDLYSDLYIDLYSDPYSDPSLICPRIHSTTPDTPDYNGVVVGKAFAETRT